MAALLYLGETVHARHLWERSEKPDQVMQDWWNVGQAMMGGKSPTAALTVCEQHPAPLNAYATEVATAIERRRTAEKAEGTGGKNSNNGQGDRFLAGKLEDVVSFLETKKWNA